MNIEVLHPGMYTTIQDRGRRGYERYGVSVGGAMDEDALRLANLLVGNCENSACLEATMTGPKLLFHSSCIFSITGGDLRPHMDGEEIPMWRPCYARAGSVLSFGGVHNGCRAYIAFAGGLAVPIVLGSRSTDVKACMGGYSGRPLRKGDALPIGTTRIQLELERNRRRWGMSHALRPVYDGVLRVVAGTEHKRFTADSIRSFCSETYTVTSDANRMGYRLEGPLLRLKEAYEPLSEAVTFGTIQVPGGGQPIILGADRQTTGGYPKLGTVISVDLPSFAQLKPGDSVSFQFVSVEHAQRLYREREQQIRLLQRAIEIRY